MKGLHGLYRHPSSCFSWILTAGGAEQPSYHSRVRREGLGQLPGLGWTVCGKEKERVDAYRGAPQCEREHKQPLQRVGSAVARPEAELSSLYQDPGQASSCSMLEDTGMVGMA